MDTTTQTAPTEFHVRQEADALVLDLAAGCVHLRTAVYDVLSEHRSTHEINTYHHRYPIHLVARYRDQIARGGDEVEKDVMERFPGSPAEASQDSDRIFAQRKSQGIVEFADIPKLFEVGQDVLFSKEQPIGGTFVGMELIHSFLSSYLQVRMAVIHGLGGKPQSGTYTFNIPAFNGVRAIASLPLRALDAETKKKLAARGENFSRFLTPGSYAQYQGSLIQDSWFGPQEYRADGRVVLDPKSFQRVDGNQWRYSCHYSGIENTDDLEENVEIELDADHCWMCMPYLYGFSMNAKRWGRLCVDGLSSIEWRKDAFEKMVLPDKEKRMVHALVKYHGHGITDLIEGKGGGCIFLLHGEPGGGKTLLSESVAELLERPLYSVSVGELGTEPQTLETRLRNILDVAAVWNAVILLDEADIFLEERNQHDIARNAMVGVFLRQLEYHNGVLFLTTNRVRNIDQAFYSRISVALRFNAADTEKRTLIWKSLLEFAGLDTTWSETLGHHEANGRQVKNAIRLAQTLAASENRAVLLADLDEAVQQALSFQATTQKNVSSMGERKQITAYTDGACLGNPGPGGWGAWLLCEGHERSLSGGERETTNNRMELMAAIQTLEALKVPCDVVLWTDSQYVRQGITEWLPGWIRKGWRTSSGKPVKNQDLWERLTLAAARHQVQWEWVKGHAGVEGNERADQLASAAALDQKKR